MFDAEELSGVCRKAAGEDVALLSGDELLAALRHMEVARSAFDAAHAAVLAEAEVRQETKVRFGLSTAEWVAHECHVPRPTVHRRVKLGVRLRGASEVDAALAKGAVSPEHAQVLAAAVAHPRVGPMLLDQVAELIEDAHLAPFPAWETRVAELVELLDQDGGFDPNRELARNRLHLSSHGDGALTMSGELVEQCAFTVRDAIEAESDRLFRKFQADHAQSDDIAIPPRATLRALALESLIRQGLARPISETAGPAADVSLIIRSHGGEHDHGVAGCSDGCDLEDRYRDVITPDGYHVRPSLAALLCCDGAIHALVEDSLGVPLDHGRAIRLATADQRRALAWRDGGCVFPGCDRPVSWCDAHHVIWWRRLGPTDIDNLALLCRHHHGVTHRRGWDMVVTPDQRFTWTTPSGDVLHSQRHRGRPPDW